MLLINFSNALDNTCIKYDHVMHCVASVCLSYLSLPLRHSFPVDPETQTDQEYHPSDDPSSFSAELPGKQSHFDHTYIAHSFSLILALVAVAIVLLSVAPILMHSLLL